MLELLTVDHDLFPISRDPPEGGTLPPRTVYPASCVASFQFLGIPPKGEQEGTPYICISLDTEFPISRDPPEGGTGFVLTSV